VRSGFCGETYSHIDIIVMSIYTFVLQKKQKGLYCYKIKIKIMLTIEEVSKRLGDRNLKKVSDNTGISYPTVWKIANNRAGNVGYETVKTLSDYLEAQG